MFSTIVLATGNPHKVAELRAIFAQELAGACVRVLGLADLPGGAPEFVEPAETGTTFEANARIKALSYAAQCGRVCLADDSGIEIDALGAARDSAPRPGVISSHYSTDGRETGASRVERDAANNARVLRELEGVATARRAARFVCCMCLVVPGADGAEGKIVHETRGTFEGRIGSPPEVPCGANGFGYDPLFLVAPAFAVTAAALGAEEKNRVSHRAAAARKMAGFFRSEG